MSVLGKRTRSALDIASAAGRTTRSSSKRPSTTSSASSFVIASDADPENPFITTRSAARKKARLDTSSGAENVDGLVQLSLAGSATGKRSAVAPLDGVGATGPAKHGAPESIIPPSVPTPESSPAATPRHRDAATRSTRKVPVTPRHRVGALGSLKPWTPQSLRTPATPRTSLPSVYADAKRLFHVSVDSGEIIGRQRERDELTAFVSSRLDARTSGCMYVSGPPGTGKSALVSEVMAGLGQARSSYINCMSIRSAADVYARILDDFGAQQVLQGDESATLEALLKRRNAAYLVVLDEIDRLVELDQDFLYKLFEWALRKTSLVLVGIANALDLTDRFLPRLKAKSMKPQLLPIMPYTVPEIISIIATKLRTLLPPMPMNVAPDYVPMIHPAAIQFVARKVAAQTGDLRKAFSICLRSLDLIEAETRAKLGNELISSPSQTPTRTPLSENINLSSPSTSRSPTKKPTQSPSNPLIHLTSETAPRATIAHVARITASAFSQGLTSRMTHLNLQQKAVLCALSALETHLRSDAAVFSTPSKSASAAPTVRAVYNAYVRLAKRENRLCALTSTEFRDVLGSLEAVSLVAWVDARGLSDSITPRRGRKRVLFGTSWEDRKVASCVGKKEVRDALKEGEAAGSQILLGMLEVGEEN